MTAADAWADPLARPLKLGFTGTQRGMTLRQYERINYFLAIWFRHRYSQHELHHGDCIGADLNADEMVRDLRERHADPLRISLHIHPPSDPKKRAFRTAFSHGDVIYPEKPYIARNHDIVDATEWLVAAPHDVFHTTCRHGTCATIRYAQKVGKKAFVFLPDGRFETIEP